MEAIEALGGVLTLAYGAQFCFGWLAALATWGFCHNAYATPVNVARRGTV